MPVTENLASRRWLFEALGRYIHWELPRHPPVENSWWRGCIKGQCRTRLLVPGISLQLVLEHWTGLTLVLKQYHHSYMKCHLSISKALLGQFIWILLNLFHYNNRHQDSKDSVIIQVVGRSKDTVVFHHLLPQKSSWLWHSGPWQSGRRHGPSSVCSSTGRQGWQGTTGGCMATSIVKRRLTGFTKYLTALDYVFWDPLQRGRETSKNFSVWWW